MIPFSGSRDMKVKVNRAGKLFILLTILLGIAAVNTGNNLLYIVVSLLLATMLLSGMISYQNLKGLRLNLKPPKEIYAGIPAEFGISIRKEGKLPSFMIDVFGNGENILFPYVGTKPVKGKIGFLFPKRGEVEKVILVVSSEFPLGMFVRYYTLEIPIKLVIFPKPLPTKEFLSSGFENKEGLQESFTSVGYEELKEIRDYRGEPMKLIHWKVLAKTDSLKVKDMSALEKGAVILTLNSVSGDLETKLSKLTYLVNKLMNRGYAVGVDLGRVKIPPGKGEKHRLKILRALALY